MPKNVVIFSDGTGQRGGVTFDERRSNIYKLFRACRCGPDSCVDPNLQLTYYDPGLGTIPERAGILGSLYRKVHNLVSQATGLGITKNIVDCYAEIVRMWEPGDSIYLFGFSRGAYTVRCVAAVLSLCGVPTKGPDGSNIKRDEKTLRSIAREAVTKVYQHVGSPKDEEYLEQRRALAKQFREKHRAGDENKANVYPHFIGVFDTVASIASYLSLGILAVAITAVLVTLSAVLSFAAFTFGVWLSWLMMGVTAIAAAWYLVTHLKFASNLPGHSIWNTIHLTAPRMQFYDKSLNPNVGYARHALAIDEHREAFDRVPWGNKSTDWPDRGQGNPVWLKQLWFAGNHSDVGGSYPENESRLSDIALQWMLEEAQKVPNPLQFDGGVLKLFPSPAGMQHDETTGMVFRYAAKIDRKLVEDATLHPSVLERFTCQSVLHYDEMRPYRPNNLRSHQRVASYYVPAVSQIA